MSKPPDNTAEHATPAEPSAAWPSLPLAAWQDTYATVHMWTQIVGKIRLVQTPWINHSWHVTQYVTARGLTTSPIPHGTRTFEIDFDFIDHQLVVRSSDGARRTLALVPRAVADFYGELMSILTELGLPVRIRTKPNEVERAIPFPSDREHHAYDADYMNRFWRILVQTDRVMKAFRARFLGKCSPIHFFWGSFDLAVTRFSGRTAPPHPGGVPNFPDWVARTARDSQAVLNAASYKNLVQQSVPRGKPTFRLEDPTFFQAIATQHLPPGPGPRITTQSAQSYLGAADVR